MFDICLEIDYKSDENVQFLTLLNDNVSGFAYEFFEISLIKRTEFGPKSQIKFCVKDFSLEFSNDFQLEFEVKSHENKKFNFSMKHEIKVEDIRKKESKKFLTDWKPNGHSDDIKTVIPNNLFSELKKGMGELRFPGILHISHLIHSNMFINMILILSLLKCKKMTNKLKVLL